jgi:multiple sugar transport system substrate-binding protein
MSRSVAMARFAAVGVLLFSLACSGSASNGATGGATGAKPAAGPVTLTIWAMGDEGDKLGNSDVLQGFQKDNPDIKVNVTAIPWSVARHQP